MTMGFRVLPCRRRVPKDMVRSFSSLPVANVSDVMSRMMAGGARLRPMHDGGVLAGSVITVRARPGDNLMFHKAIDLAEAGDVVVVDAGGDLTNALAGELMVAHAKQRGLAGFVINGAIRDARAIREGTFPVFAAGVTHRGPYKSGPGEINVPIAIDGMVIEPGDLVMGDDDGVVSVPFDQIFDIFAAASAKHLAEERQMQAILQGNSDRSWVDQELARLQCEIVAP